MLIKKIFATALLHVSIFPVNATTYTVTNTNDAGAGSLRQAITDINIYPGTHIIAFNIPLSDSNFIAGQGVWKITPQTTLPIIMRSNLLIDGTTQTTNQGNQNIFGPEILLDGNHQYGSDFAFHLYNSSGVTIKGFIIGRFTVGIEISGSTSQNNIIKGNYIGCNYNAMDTLCNTHGIELLTGPHNNTIGGNTIADRNIVSGNTHVGIRIVGSNYNVIKGNFVGLNRTGNGPVKNYDGISIEGTAKYNIIGGYTVNDRNYVSGNVAYGIPVFGGGCSNNIIVGNYIGTDTSGTIAIPNTYGVLYDDGASYNRLGGKAAGAGNLLSGNSGYGVFLYNPGTQKDTVIGNLIGTNHDGISAIPNANGIVIDGPSYKHYVDSNVISGNTQMGITIHIGGSDSNVIIRNKIGTDISGSLPLGNSIDGVRIGEGPRYNIIGKPGMGNIIAFNGENGISVLNASDICNTFSCNSIFSNGSLGIDLYPAGPNANDAGDLDSGPNQSMNYPVIDSIVYIPGNAVVFGHADVIMPVYTRIELFIAEPDFTGYGEGKTYLGYTFPLSDGTWCDTVGAISTDFLTSTATDIAGNTSEFSFDFPNPPVIIFENETSKVQVTVRPNPFTDNTWIEISTKEIRWLNADLFSIRGKHIISFTSKSNVINICGNQISSGLYFCVLTVNGEKLPAVRLVKE